MRHSPFRSCLVACATLLVLPSANVAAAPKESVLQAVQLSVPKKNIKERRHSELSLMPDNFADVISVNEFNDLIAFLLTKTATKK